jgi:hypothetical protein
MESKVIELLLSDILRHSDIAICSIRAGEPNLDAVMLARAAAKAAYYTLGHFDQDTIDYLEVYEFMLEIVSDIYPILPD